MIQAEREQGVPFKERFELLVESGQADERTVDATRKALRIVESHYDIQLTEELGASLVNHLATTLKRLLDGKTLSEATDIVWNELANYPEEVALAESIVAELQKLLEIPLVRDEIGFIAIHLCKIKIEAGLNHGI